jgi:hypothetical protein
MPAGQKPGAVLSGAADRRAVVMDHFNSLNWYEALAIISGRRRRFDWLDRRAGDRHRLDDWRHCLLLHNRFDNLLLLLSCELLRLFFLLTLQLGLLLIMLTDAHPASGTMNIKGLHEFSHAGLFCALQTRTARRMLAR